MLRLLHTRLLAVGFDRSNASMFGAEPLMADAALLVLIAGATVVAVQGLGNLLVVAALVAPAAAASLAFRRITQRMAAAVALAIAGGAAGLYLSYYAGTAAGASVAACRWWPTCSPSPPTWWWHRFGTGDRRHTMGECRSPSLTPVTGSSTC